MSQESAVAIDVDVFISYSREDERIAAAFARALEKQRLSVSWDRWIPTGTTFDKWIQARVAAARCVTVLWSHISVDSDWVRAEAAKAKDRGIFFPILIEAVDLPIPFNLTQTADLTGWSGGDDPRLDAVAQAVVRFVRGELTPGVAQPSPRAWWRLRGRTAALGGAMTLLVAAATWWWLSHAPDAQKTAEAVREVTQQLEQYKTTSSSGRQARAELDVIDQRLNRALSDDPNAIQLRKLKAEVYRVAGRDSDAVAYITQATSDIPGNSVLYNELGFIHQRMARYPEAIDAYRKSIAVNSDPSAVAVAYANLAELFITRQEFDEAKKSFRAGLALGPNRHQLCCTLRDVVQTDQAFTDMGDLLRANCSEEEATCESR